MLFDVSVLLFEAVKRSMPLFPLPVPFVLMIFDIIELLVELVDIKIPTLLLVPFVVMLFDVTVLFEPSSIIMPMLALLVPFVVILFDVTVLFEPIQK